MKKKSLFFIALLISVTTYINTCFSQAKAFNINGQLTTHESALLKEVAIQLVQASNKKLVKIEYADSLGAFSFQQIPAGSYVIITQSMIFGRYESAPFLHQQTTQLGVITLTPAPTALKEAAVTAVKPFIQQQYDKTVLNVSGSISAAGGTALEVLEKAPGITIDQNDNIAMRGRQGVLVMIDGKQVPMTGQDLANMLRNMSASQIETIDLITNPSAKYDAAGNAGIIDIRLKKGKTSGTNGNLSLSLSQGRYPKLNPSLNFNSKHKNLNIFGSYNYAYREDINDLTIYRQFYDADNKYTGGNNYQNLFKYRNNSHNTRIGADYTINKKMMIGIAANGIFYQGNITTNSVAQTLNAQQENTGSFITTGNNQPHRNNTSINLNYKYTLDTSGRELTADLDYARFNSAETQNYLTRYFDTQQWENKTPYALFGDLNGDLSIRSVKIDYTQPLKIIGAGMQAGIKSSWVKSDNDVQFFDRSNGGNVLDEGKSNRFIYKENINAAYVNVSKKWSHLSLQLGLRAENTQTNGFQVIGAKTFNRDYTQLFPSGYIGYEFNTTHDLGLSMSRRIDRPSYRQLNPFKVFLDPLTSAAGNPFLLPETTNSFELTHTFRQQYTTKIGYSRTRDNILIVLSPDTEPNTILQTGRNLAMYDYYNLSFGFPVTIRKWLSSTNTALLYYGNYKGDLVNTHLNVSRVSFNFNSVNTITLRPLTTMEITGSYESRSYYGFLDVNSFWFVSAGVQQQLWHKKASLKLNLSDIFFTNQTNAVTRLTGYGETFKQKRDTRVLTLTFNYKFGGGSSSGNKRQTGAEEEKRRAG
ncbi:TonB-dependent receptor domain-containing protein [Chitinophaga arvensicola]|uniref:Outer membrane receptor proteins, mostly Fe transport n=1 Tax=Chitinophaga arvensicola TaxID=29529 RepID=A0A1I0S727_9BACT|nr:TonB-dependent receptor [Chitinophaga arvensicola]SEW51219.1 Outer membrane receptor proteins, mostly Fe transport [Chitinophaga arvensicola]